MNEQESLTMSVLADLRREIDRIDAELLSALGKRLSLCAEVAEFKSANNVPMMQPDRVEQVKNERAVVAPYYGLRPEFVRKLYVLIIEEACCLEDAIIERER